jgi:hypothetical protein
LLTGIIRRRERPAAERKGEMMDEAFEARRATGIRGENVVTEALGEN